MGSELFTPQWYEHWSALEAEGSCCGSISVLELHPATPRIGGLVGYSAWRNESVAK